MSFQLNSLVQRVGWISKKKTNQSVICLSLCPLCGNDNSFKRMCKTKFPFYVIHNKGPYGSLVKKSHIQFTRTLRDNFSHHAARTRILHPIHSTIFVSTPILIKLLWKLQTGNTRWSRGTSDLLGYGIIRRENR